MERAKIKVSGVRAVPVCLKDIPRGIKGATIRFEYADSLWDSLSKTVVFRGCVTKDVVNAGEVVTIPPEVVAQAGQYLYVGVFGTDAENTVIVPTLWADLGKIRPAADPSGDESTDESLPVWAQLQEQIDDLKENGSGPNGTAGEDGGYYTPEVTQPAEDTLQFDFTPSKADMPAVEPVQVKLPAGQGSGGNADYVSIEPADDDIPKVYFTGTLPTSKADEDVRLTMHYISKTADFIYPVTLKVQGSSSANYAKKNFTLKPYKDDTYESKKKLAFKNWPEMNKFVLKAHWIDHSHVRNVGTAKLWGKIVKSRSDYDSLPEELRNAPNNGATDGFTVKVFANGVYQGLYEWIVPKDKLFGQDSDIATHSILNSEWNNQPTCAFATTSPSMSGNWSEELQDSLSSDISTSFANLIKFVAGSTDEEFVANAENYFDVQSVIDYNIYARIFCIVDNLCRNQIFFTYDGVKWYEGVWDLDAVLGLPPTTRGFFAYNTEFQSGYIAYLDHGVTNLLYQRVENLFIDRFKARYAELRSGVLSIENILDVYERLTDVIITYDGLLAEDYASTTGGGAFTGIPYKTENTIQQIRNFVAQRIPYMDSVIAAMTEPVPCTGITLSANTLTFTAEGSQTLTANVTPDGCTDAVTWESDNTSVATVNGGVVTAIANGSATITAKCGEYSASCSVAVSGIAEPVPCTGITLDKTELTFNTESSQTIIATATPSDTTDKIVWTSENANVATVQDGVVTPVDNGSSVITATCGSHSASCTVLVSGLGMDEQTIALNRVGLWKETGLDSSLTRWKTSDIMPLPTGFNYDTITVDDTSNQTAITLFDSEQNFVKENAATPATYVVQNVQYYAVAKSDSAATTLDVKFTETYPGAIKCPAPSVGLWKSTGLDSSATNWRTSDKYEIPADITTGKIKFADGVSKSRIITTFDDDGNFIKENANVSEITFDGTVKYFAVALNVQTSDALQKNIQALYVYIE